MGFKQCNSRQIVHQSQQKLARGAKCHFLNDTFLHCILNGSVQLLAILFNSKGYTNGM